MRFLAVELKATPLLTKGIYRFDYGDTARMAPIVKMYALRHDFVSSPIQAGGLRFHGMAPSICEFYYTSLIQANAVLNWGPFK